MQDVITVACAALPDAARVIGFRGNEAISMPYRIAIDLLVPRAGDDEDDGALPALITKLEGERLSLTFDRQDGRPPLHWHGLVGGAELVYDTPSASLWTLVVVPRFAQLDLTRHNRIFVDEPVPKIIAAVLDQSGLEPSDYELRLGSDYKPREHVFQYQESDFAFLSRLMEREGIYYFFEQGDDRERLVITDSSAYHKDFTPDAVRFVPSAGKDQTFTRAEALDTWKLRSARTTSKVRLTDYDYNRPDLDVSAGADVAARGFGEMRLFAENFTRPDEGKRLANVRAQQLVAESTAFIATGNVMYLRPGYTFQLDEHPRSAFNAKHLVTSIAHVANQAAHALNVEQIFGYDTDDLYRSTITAIPASMQFRPRRLTPIPRADGVLTAFVDGPADSQYAQIDKQGRYKVRVKFDEGDLADGRASTFVRMLQPHGGSTEGFHFPLRKGTEVSLLFLGGDPDRPIIAGVVPNAKTPSVVTGDNHTKNVIQTGGGNRLEIQDAEGGKYIKWTTPHKNTMFHMGAPHNPVDDVQLQTDGTYGTYIGNTWTVRVGNTLEWYIEAPATQYYNDSLEETTCGFFHQDIKNGFLQVIHEGFDQNVTGKYNQRIFGDHMQEFHGTHKHTINGFRDQKMLAGFKQEISGRAFEQSAHQGMIQTVDGGDLIQNIAEDHQHHVDGSLFLTVGGDATIHVKGNLEQTVDGTSDWFEANHDNKIFAGEKTETILGTVTDIAIVNKNDIALGAIVELKGGLCITTNQSVEVKIKTAAYVEELTDSLKKTNFMVNHATMFIVG